MVADNASVVVGARIPAQLARQVREHAAARQMSVSAFLAALLAAAVGRTE